MTAKQKPVQFRELKVKVLIEIPARVEEQTINVFKAFCPNCGYMGLEYGKKRCGCGCQLSWRETKNADMS